MKDLAKSLPIQKGERERGLGGRTRRKKMKEQKRKKKKENKDC